MLKIFDINDIAVTYSPELDAVLFQEIVSTRWEEGERVAESQLLFALDVDSYNTFRKKLKKVKNIKKKKVK